jgi:hypothetical protein
MQSAYETNFTDIQTYLLNYELNKETKAPGGSLGIFCFKTKYEANSYLHVYLNDLNIRYKILAVKVDGRRGKTPQKIGYYRYHEFYAGNKDHETVNTILGSICYPSVIPLYEVPYDSPYI